jgi:hypothetical protein
MNHIKLFESWKEERKTNEGFWNSIFGSPTVKDAAKSNLRGQGHSIIGKDEDEENYVMYNGQKFYPSQITREAEIRSIFDFALGSEVL